MVEREPTAYNVLVVDDEPDIATTIARGLSQKGYRAEAFSDPAIALSKFKPNFYHLSILDIRMPGINGFQLYRQLKEKDPALPVCFMTAFEIFPEEYEKVFPQHDVRAFIKKPVRIATLIDIVRDVLEGNLKRGKG